MKLELAAFEARNDGVEMLSDAEIAEVLMDAGGEGTESEDIWNFR